MNMNIAIKKEIPSISYFFSSNHKAEKVLN